MANIAKWMLDLIGNPKTAKFVETLKHSDLPKNWADDPEVVGLAERAYQQGGTKSPFFKAYFGDSKVVNKSGKPLTVYHGTPESGFDEFYPGTTWTTSDFPYAMMYRDKGFFGQSDADIYNLFAKQKNPVNVGNIDYKVSPDTLKELSKKSGIPYEDIKAISQDEFADRLWGITRSDKFRNALVDKGNDGIIAIENNHPSYGVFSPSQVKSIENRGTFNPDDPNIYRALAPVGVGLGTLAAAGMIPDTEASAKSAYIASPEMKAAMMGIRDEPVKDAWNPVEALATAPIGALTTGARAASVGIDALLSALLGD